MQLVLEFLHLHLEHGIVSSKVSQLLEPWRAVTLAIAATTCAAFIWQHRCFQPVQLVEALAKLAFQAHLFKPPGFALALQLILQLDCRSSRLVYLCVQAISLGVHPVQQSFHF